MKNIKELTEEEAKQILEFVYPEHKDSHVKLSLEPTILEDGSQQVTFGMRPMIGIEYHNGQDRCMLHFDNTKAVLWLYKNGVDITELLEANSHFSEMAEDFDDFAFAITEMAKGEEGFAWLKKGNWTLDFVKKKCQELVDKYYYKDYK